MRAPKEENGPCATPLEKAVAFRSLTWEERRQLLRFAAHLARRFNGRVNYADEEDLVQEAISRALDLRNIRRWYPEKKTFFYFLADCIRSIASEWQKKARTTDLGEDPPWPFQHNEQTDARIMLERMWEALKLRRHAQEIFDLKSQGYTAREIQERLGLKSEVFSAATKWIERAWRQEGFRK